MNYYYDRNDFMVGHVFSEYYKYYQGNTCKGYEKREREREKKLLLILTCWGEHPNFLWGPWII